MPVDEDADVEEREPSRPSRPDAGNDTTPDIVETPDTTPEDDTTPEPGDTTPEPGDTTTPPDTTPPDTTPPVDTTPPPQIFDPGPRPADLVTKEFSCPERWSRSPIRIVEVMINPNNSEGQETSTEWFEIRNISEQRYDLMGVTIEDDDYDIFQLGDEMHDYEGFYQDASRSFIEPGEIFPFYQAVNEKDCRDPSAHPDCKAYLGEHFYVFRRDDGMAIANSGDEIYLLDTQGRVLDCMVYNSSDDVEGYSWQRFPVREGLGYTDEWCLTQEKEEFRYNDNSQRVDGVYRAGDYGTPGADFKCW